MAELDEVFASTDASGSGEWPGEILKRVQVGGGNQLGDILLCGAAIRCEDIRIHVNCHLHYMIHHIIYVHIVCDLQSHDVANSSRDDSLEIDRIT
jgi:hypothetical protein